jgi:hypothetical protein
MNLEEHIKSWVLYDNQIKAYNDKVKEIRTKKNSLGQNIVEYMKRNHPRHSTIEISDGKLKISNTNTQTPLSYKFVEESIKSYFNDEKLTNDLMNYIKNRRETKSNIEIKRFYSS